MIIAPIAGDRIKTADGLPSKVLSFTNYLPDGPAVLVDATAGDDTVYLRDIVELNGKKVKFVKNSGGNKVLELDGYLKRTFQLPQPGEVLSSKVSGETRKYKVNRIRLHVPDRLASGMILEVEDVDTAEKVDLTLGQITDIDHYLFARSKFLAYYADYREKGSA